MLTFCCIYTCKENNHFFPYEHRNTIILVKINSKVHIKGKKLLKHAFLVIALQDDLKIKESHTCMWGHEASRVGSSSSGSKSGLSLGGSVLKILELICNKKMKFNCITFYSSTEHTEQGIAFILKVHEVTPAKKKNNTFFFTFFKSPEFKLRKA